MSMKLATPKLSEDRLTELQGYVRERWLRAKEARMGQVEGDYAMWSSAYDAVPLEKMRTVPFYKASNLVVPLIRIFLDTFVARTLNIIYATRPLYVIEGLPADTKEGFELYLNRKAMYDWNAYRRSRDICFRGNKNGTTVEKTIYTECNTIDVNAISDNQISEETYTYYSGPCSKPVPFEDFYVYPEQVNELDDAKIIFNRTRYTEEDAQDKIDSGEWTVKDGYSAQTYLKIPADSKRRKQESDAKVVNAWAREVHVIESYLCYALENKGPKYNLIVHFEEFSGDILNFYYNPYPRNIRIHSDYRPFPKEDLFYGDSLCKVLGTAQEEASRIHNERRDNSTIASSVVFKRRSGSLLPNPSTNFYPGKVFDLDDMDDLDVINIGRNYSDMIEQEDYTFNLAEKVSGIGEVMQAASTGSVGKRGIYNTMGTIGVIAEGNQRQDTNIRDVREVIGRIGLVSARLQAKFAPDDPLIETLPQSAQDGARKGLAIMGSDKAKYLRFEVKTSNAGISGEIEKANLMAIAGVLDKYGATVQQLGQQLLSPGLNAGLRMILNDIVIMQRGMAKRLLKAFNEWDAINELPDIGSAIEATQPGGSKGTAGASAEGVPGGAPDNGSVPGAQPGLSQQLLAGVASLPSLPIRPNGR